MKLLIDTHVLIWALQNTAQLPSRVITLLADGTNEVLVSAGSAYEIEFKRARSQELTGLPADLEAAAEAMGFDWLPVSPAHAVMAGRLPRIHGDPFDRIIVAQALTENATIVSRDPFIEPYGVPVLW